MSITKSATHPRSNVVARFPRSSFGRRVIERGELAVEAEVDGESGPESSGFNLKGGGLDGAGGAEVVIFLSKSTRDSSLRSMELSWSSTRVRRAPMVMGWPSLSVTRYWPGLPRVWSSLRCNSLMRTIMLRWPWLYCSMTSRTSYGFRACWNFRRATKYLIFRIPRIAFRCASVNLKSKFHTINKSIVLYIQIDWGIPVLIVISAQIWS